MADVGLRKKDGTWCLSKDEEFERWGEHIMEVFDAEVVDEEIKRSEIYKHEQREAKEFKGHVGPLSQLIMIGAIYCDLCGRLVDEG